MRVNPDKPILHRWAVGWCALFFLPCLALAQVPPDPSDPCVDSALETGGCVFYEVATVYTYTGDSRHFAWVPDPTDMAARDRLFYYAEIRTWPLDNLVTTRQTVSAVEELSWTPSIGGHYYLRVKACDPQLIPGGDPVNTIPSEHCSDWANSMNDANTPANLPGWFVFVAVKPPTGGGIE